MDTILTTFRPGDAYKDVGSGVDVDHVNREARNMLMAYLAEPIRDMYDSMYSSLISKKGTLKDFQRNLQAVPTWNASVLEECCNILRSKCDGLEDIVSALFLERIKVLSILRVCDDDTRIPVKIPSVTRFCHKVFERCAEEFYKDPVIFQKGREDVKRQIILKSIENVVQRMLPIKQILSVFMKQGGESKHQDVDENVKPVDDKPLENADTVNIVKHDDPPEIQAFGESDFMDREPQWNHAPDPVPPINDDMHPLGDNAFLFEGGDDRDVDVLPGE